MISTSKVNLYIQCLYLLIFTKLFISNGFYYKYLFTILLILLIVFINFNDVFTFNIM